MSLTSKHTRKHFPTYCDIYYHEYVVGHSCNSYHLTLYCIGQVNTITIYPCLLGWDAVWRELRAC